MTTSTTVAFHNPLHHLHPPPTAAGVAAGALALVVLTLVWRHRARARSYQTARLLHTARDILGKDTTLSRHAWGHPPVRHNRHHQVTVIRYGFRGHLNDTKLEALTKAHTKQMGGPVAVDVDHLRDTASVRLLPPAPTLPTRIEHPDTAINGREIPFATGLDGKPVAWTLASSTPHALVVGASGAGKSRALETIIVEAIRRGISVAICDPKRISLLELRDLDGVERYAGDEPTMTRLLADVAKEIDRRSQMLEQRATTEARLPPLLVVIDEFVTMVDKLRTAHGKGEPQALVDFRTIVLTGRQLRVHVLLATQRPDAEWVKGALRDQLGCRILIGRAKDGTRRMVEIDSTPSVSARGRAIAMNDGHEQECQIWLTEPARARQLAPDTPPAPVLFTPAVHALLTPPVHTRERPRNGAQLPLPDGTAERVAALTEGGKTVREISAELGISVGAVSKYRKRSTAMTVDPSEDGSVPSR